MEVVHRIDVDGLNVRPALPNGKKLILCSLSDFSFHYIEDEYLDLAWQGRAIYDLYYIPEDVWTYFTSYNFNYNPLDHSASYELKAGKHAEINKSVFGEPIDDFVAHEANEELASLLSKTLSNVSTAVQAVRDGYPASSTDSAIQGRINGLETLIASLNADKGDVDEKNIKYTYLVFVGKLAITITNNLSVIESRLALENNITYSQVAREVASNWFNVNRSGGIINDVTVRTDINANATLTTVIDEINGLIDTINAEDTAEFTRDITATQVLALLPSDNADNDEG